MLKALLKKIPKLFSSNIAIDLGTANTLLYKSGEGIVLNEPSVIALVSYKGSFIPYAFGSEAKMMLGKTPHDIKAIRPLKDGVIADFNAAEEMIKHFIYTVKKKKITLIKPLIVVCVPYGSTPVERRAIQNAVESAGAKDVYLIEEPMAAAIGSKLPILEPIGSMIVDIGGGTTEVGIISLGGIVNAKSIRVGGDAMDDAIVSYIKKTHNISIGESTAERIKKEIYLDLDHFNKKLFKKNPNKKITFKEKLKNSDSNILDESINKKHGLNKKIISIYGRDLSNGIPKEIKVSSYNVASSLIEQVNSIINAIKSVLESSPPELSSDLAVNGVMLTGGGALLEGLRDVIEKAINLPVYVAEDPLNCVVNGTGEVAETWPKLRYVVFKQH